MIDNNGNGKFHIIMYLFYALAIKMPIKTPSYLTSCLNIDIGFHCLKEGIYFENHIRTGKIPTVIIKTTLRCNMFNAFGDPDLDPVSENPDYGRPIPLRKNGVSTGDQLVRLLTFEDTYDARVIDIRAPGFVATPVMLRRYLDYLQVRNVHDRDQYGDTPIANLLRVGELRTHYDFIMPLLRALLIMRVDPNSMIMLPPEEVLSSERHPLPVSLLQFVLGAERFKYHLMAYDGRVRYEYIKFEAAQILIQAGADPNASLDAGLIEHIAQRYRRDPDIQAGETALLFAIRLSGNDPIPERDALIDTLLKNPRTNVFVKNAKGQNAMDLLLNRIKVEGKNAINTALLSVLEQKGLSPTPSLLGRLKASLQQLLFPAGELELEYGGFEEAANGAAAAAPQQDRKAGQEGQLPLYKQQLSESKEEEESKEDDELRMQSKSNGKP